MAGFKTACGDWKDFRNLPNHTEIDFHHTEGECPEDVFHERMDKSYRQALSGLKIAYEEGKQYLILIHGWSTSRPGATTFRSQIRKLMRSKDAMPHIVRSRCIQHDTCFVAAIRPSRDR